MYSDTSLQCFLVSQHFSIMFAVSENSGSKKPSAPSSHTKFCEDHFRCCNKFSSPLWNTDSFGCKVARSPITGQFHWLDSPLNIILDALKGTLAACASCSREYWSSTSSQTGCRAKKFSFCLLGDSEPYYSNLMYNACYVYCILTCVTSRCVTGIAIKLLTQAATFAPEMFSSLFFFFCLAHE